MTYSTSDTSLPMQSSPKTPREPCEKALTLYLASFLKGTTESSRRKFQPKACKSEPQIASRHTVGETAFRQVRSQSSQFSRLPRKLSCVLFEAFDESASGALNGEDLTSGMRDLVFGDESTKLKLAFRLLGSEGEKLRRSECRRALYEVAIACGYRIRGFGIYDRCALFYLSSQNLIDEAICDLFSPDGRRRDQITFEHFCSFSMRAQADVPLTVSVVLISEILLFVFDRLGIFERLLYFQSPKSSLRARNGPGNRAHKTCREARVPRPSLGFYGLDKLARVKHLRHFQPLRQVLGYALITVVHIQFKEPHLEESSKSEPASPSKLRKSSESVLSQLGFKLSPTLARPRAVSASRRESLHSRGALLLQSRRLKAQQIWHSGLVYRQVGRSLVQPFWLEMRDRELYCFARKGDKQPDMIFLLEGCHLLQREKSELVLKSQDLSLLCLELVFPEGGSLELLFSQAEDYEEWRRLLQVVVEGFSLEHAYHLHSVDQVPEGLSIFNGFSYQTGVPVNILEVPATHPERESLVESAEVAHHPLIAPVIEVRHTLTHTYIVFEDQEGGSLQEYIEARRKRGLSQRVVKGLLVQLVDLVAFCKSVGLVLGDFSLESFKLASHIAEEDGESLPQIRLTSFNSFRRLRPTSESRDSQAADKTWSYESDCDVLTVGRIVERIARAAKPGHLGFFQNLGKLIERMVEQEESKRIKAEHIGRVVPLL